MELIVTLASANLIYLLIAFCSSFISYMLYDFMQDGMILDFYRKAIEKLPSILGKPLGLCLKCFHVWINIFIFSIHVIEGGNINLFFFIIATAISYHILLKNWYN